MHLAASTEGYLDQTQPVARKPGSRKLSSDVYCQFPFPRNPWAVSMSWRIGLPGLGKRCLFGDATIDRLRKMRRGEPSRPSTKKRGVLKGKKRKSRLLGGNNDRPFGEAPELLRSAAWSPGVSSCYRARPSCLGFSRGM